MAQDAVARLKDDASARIETDPKGALARFERVLKAEPDDISSWADVGTLHLRLGGLQAAASAFGEVQRIAEANADAEWAQYAKDQLAQIETRSRQRAGRRRADGETENSANAKGGSGASEVRPQAAGSKRAAPREVAEPPVPAVPAAEVVAAAPSPQSGPGKVASSVGAATLSTVAGMGLLMLIVAGAVSQLWPYPYVRVALLRTLDDLLAAALLGYFAGLLLQRFWSRYLVLRLAVHAVAATMILGSLWMLISGLMPLGGLFVECAEIANIKPACHIQVEEYQKMTPEQRLELDVL